MLLAKEKIIEINPDIEQWDREYVAGQSTNYETVGNDTLYTLTANETVKVDYYVSNDASFDIDLRAYFWGFLVG